MQMWRTTYIYCGLDVHDGIVVIWKNPTEISSYKIESDSDESELCDSDDAGDEHWDIINGGQEEVSHE